MVNFLRRAHEIAAQFRADIYVVAHKDGKYFAFSSSNRDGWPPTAQQIVGEQCEGGGQPADPIRKKLSPRRSSKGLVIFRCTSRTSGLAGT